MYPPFLLYNLLFLNRMIFFKCKASLVNAMVKFPGIVIIFRINSKFLQSFYTIYPWLPLQAYFLKLLFVPILFSILLNWSSCCSSNTPTRLLPPVPFWFCFSPKAPLVSVLYLQDSFFRPSKGHILSLLGLHCRRARFDYWVGNIPWRRK